MVILNLEILLILSNVARLLDLDAEQALAEAVEKFIVRFSYIEENLEKDGFKPSAVQLERMEALWIDAKKRTK